MFRHKMHRTVTEERMNNLSSAWRLADDVFIASLSLVALVIELTGVDSTCLIINYYICFLVDKFVSTTGI